MKYIKENKNDDKTKEADDKSKTLNYSIFTTKNLDEQKEKTKNATII